MASAASSEHSVGAGSRPTARRDCSTTPESAWEKSSVRAATSASRPSRQRMRPASTFSDCSPRTRVASQAVVRVVTQEAPYASSARRTPSHATGANGWPVARNAARTAS
ncbi:hypothetical protein BO221_42810 [Archangium sp. Cb G35]|uniref:hypothetical protein n=1 Tax=Archangium sp. Cb G35 TaxID=1920190 RepID=UPI0009379F19|nr:hypothetical protein [Archangium sp. Cb G35]OJT18208.1 hypothetical protein BO221_42810 [Archangium sp. Cb G35]